MPPAKKILIPIDGSGQALRALAHAARRVRDEQVQIVLLNVQPRLPPSRFVTRSMIKNHHAAQSEAALAGARALLRRLKLEAGVHVRLGDPARTIVEFARQTRCAEIVMGTRGLGKLKGLLLGSVAGKVIQLARTPVTVVS